MKLHENKILFTQLLNFSANSLNIRPEFIEKDYWITRALQRMAQNPNAEKVVFKGGTSLSKSYRLIEINTYANPYPYIKQKISSFIANYLTVIDRKDLIEEYQLSPFEVNVLDKRRTMIEKLVSLIRFSFSGNVTVALATKIRHCYDLYYLANDSECAAYIQSVDFQNDLSELFFHDQQEFDELKGWRTKTVNDSPLLNEFPVIWERLRSTYKNELTPLAFVEIPKEQEVRKSVEKIFMNITMK